MSKIIVTHFNPDLDAVAAVWLIKRFLKGWEEAELKFTPPGKYTFDDQPVDSNPEVLYVDTGLGKFDHHRNNDIICAATLVWDFIKEETGKKDEAIERLVAVVNQVDHAQDLTWPEAEDDRYELMLHMILEGFKRVASDGDVSQRIIDFGLKALDGAHRMYQEKVDAENELEKGQEFKTRWGKAIALKTKNDVVLFLGEKKGYCLVVQLNPGAGHLKIYGRLDKGVDLTKAWKEFKKKDPDPFWFLHSSKAILANGARSQPEYQPTKLSLEEIIEILKKA
jgi:hypothetical protein